MPKTQAEFDAIIAANAARVAAKQQARDEKGRFFASQQAGRENGWIPNTPPPRLADVYRAASPVADAKFAQHQAEVVNAGPYAFNAETFARRQGEKLSRKIPSVQEAMRRQVNGE